MHKRYKKRKKCCRCYENVKSVTIVLNRRNSDYDVRKSKIEQTIVHSMFEYLIEDCECCFDDQKKYLPFSRYIQSVEDSHSNRKIYPHGSVNPWVQTGVIRPEVHGLSGTPPQHEEEVYRHKNNESSHRSPYCFNINLQCYWKPAIKRCITLFNGFWLCLCMRIPIRASARYSALCALIRNTYRMYIRTRLCASALACEPFFR